MPARFPRVRAARVAAFLLLAAAASCGCSSDRPPAPSPGGGGASETITGRERLGWDQTAASAGELSSFRYAIYVDGNRFEMTGVSCATSPGPTGFPCSAQLPALSAGTHVLELATFTDNGGVVESAKSAPLRVTVSGSTRPASENALAPAPQDVPAPGERITTADGVLLETDLVVEGHVDIVDIARTRDGRLLVAERNGAVVFHTPGGESFRAAVNPADGEILSMTPAPDFERSGHLFVVQSRPSIFRISRYRLHGQQLVDRVMVLPDVPASADPSAVLRFGPDGKLYAALDDAGNRAMAARLSEWNGKVLRVNPDGTTPDDQPSASPVLWADLSKPRGLAWSRDGQVMYLAERGADGIERLRAIVSDGRPRRAALRSSHVLPGPVGATSLSMAAGDAIPQFGGDLFVAAREGGYLLRVRFEEGNGARPMTSEKLLEGRLGELRAVVASPEGLYVANYGAVWRLFPVRKE